MSVLTDAKGSTLADRACRINHSLFGFEQSTIGAAKTKSEGELDGSDVETSTAPQGATTTLRLGSGGTSASGGSCSGSSDNGAANPTATSGPSFEACTGVWFEADGLALDMFVILDDTASTNDPVGGDADWLVLGAEPSVRSCKSVGNEAELDTATYTSNTSPSAIERPTGLSRRSSARHSEPGLQATTPPHRPHTEARKSEVARRTWGMLNPDADLEAFFAWFVGLSEPRTVCL